MAREVWVPSTVVKELIIAVLLWKTSIGPQEEQSLASSRGGCVHCLAAAEEAGGLQRRAVSLHSGLPGALQRDPCV